MDKHQIDEALADQPNDVAMGHPEAREKPLRVPLETPSLSQYSSCSHCAIWHCSLSCDGPRRSGSDKSFSLSSHGSQRSINPFPAPQNQDNWILAWLEQCEIARSHRSVREHEMSYTHPCDSNTLGGIFSDHDREILLGSEDPDPPIDNGVARQLLPNDSHAQGVPNDYSGLVGPARPLSSSAPFSGGKSIYSTYPAVSSGHASAASAHHSSILLHNSVVPQSRTHSIADSRHASSAGSARFPSDRSVSSGGSLFSNFSGRSQVSQSGRQGKRKAEDAPSHDRVPPEGKPYQCTWCFWAFKRHFDCTKHEEAVHVGFKQYICMPNGPQELESSLQVECCVFCGCREPDDEHSNLRHGIAACLKKDVYERSFPRKGGLVQHLKRLHSDSSLCDLNGLATRWTRNGNIDEQDRVWECGFCGKDEIDWHQRCKHVGSHFKKGENMRWWFGKDLSDGSYHCYYDFGDPPSQPPFGTRRAHHSTNFPTRSDLVTHMVEHHWDLWTL